MFQDIVRLFFRSNSFFVIVFSFIGSVLFSNVYYLLLGIFILVDSILNHTLKIIAQKIMGSKNYFILGKGTRPLLAKSCHIYMPSDKVKTISYGMPSGHSQTMAYIVTLYGLHLYKKDNNNYSKYLILVLLLVGTMYSRIYLENCHTVQQTIVGSIIGIITAFLTDKYILNPFNQICK